MNANSMNEVDWTKTEVGLNEMVMRIQSKLQLSSAIKVLPIAEWLSLIPSQCRQLQLLIYFLID